MKKDQINNKNNSKTNSEPSKKEDIELDNNLYFRYSRYIFQLANVLNFLAYFLCFAFFRTNITNYSWACFASITSFTALSLAAWFWCFWLNYHDIMPLRTILSSDKLKLYKCANLFFLVMVIVSLACFILYHLFPPITAIFYYIFLVFVAFISLAVILVYTLSIEKIRSFLYTRKYGIDKENMSNIVKQREEDKKLSEQDYKKKKSASVKNNKNKDNKKMEASAHLGDDNK